MISITSTPSVSFLLLDKQPSIGIDLRIIEENLLWYALKLPKAGLFPTNLYSLDSMTGQATFKHLGKVR